MNCPHCDSTAIAERMKKTALGYRTFHCHTCKRTFNERTGTPFNYLEYPTDLVLLVVLWRLRYKLSLRDLAEMCLARGFEVTHETIRDWEERFAPLMEPASGPQVLFSSKALPDCGTAAGSLPPRRYCLGNWRSRNSRPTSRSLFASCFSMVPCVSSRESFRICSLFSRRASICPTRRSTS